MAIDELKKLGIAIPIILSIILIGAIIGLILATFQDEKGTQETAIVTNESVLFAAGSVILGEDNDPRGIFLTLATNSVVLNNGTNMTIRSNNWNAYSNGSIILKAGATANIGTSPLTNTSYNYNIEATSYYYNITKGGGDTIQNITKQLPLFGTIIILILIAAIALGVFTYFGGRKKPL